MIKKLIKVLKCMNVRMNLGMLSVSLKGLYDFKSKESAIRTFIASEQYKPYVPY